jgi:hypothetical protein
MLVPEAEQDWPPRSPPAGASHDTLLDHAWSGSRGVDAVVAGGCGSNGVTSAARFATAGSLSMQNDLKLS